MDWPLALCDAGSVDFTNDTMAGDVVERKKAFENTQIHFNASQEWYYLKDQQSSELLMFKNADSQSPASSLIDIRCPSRLVLQPFGFKR